MITFKYITDFIMDISEDISAVESEKLLDTKQKHLDT